MTHLLLHSVGCSQPVRQGDVRIVYVVAGLRDHFGHAHGRIAGGHGGVSTDSRTIAGEGRAVLLCDCLDPGSLPVWRVITRLHLWIVWCIHSCLESQQPGHCDGGQHVGHRRSLGANANVRRVACCTCWR